MQHSFHFSMERASITGWLESCSGESHLSESVWPSSESAETVLCVCVCVQLC